MASKSATAETVCWFAVGDSGNYYDNGAWDHGTPWQWLTTSLRNWVRMYGRNRAVWRHVGDPRVRDAHVTIAGRASPVNLARQYAQEPRP